MSAKITLNLPLNRVEGDLEVKVEIEDGIVSEARCSGTMYRGIEKILIGRGALDGLVITPRVCGLCSTAHLTAAAKSLDMLARVSPPPDAIRMRNVALMTECLQSDMRQGFLMFAADFTNPAYKDSSFFDEAMRQYQPFKGKTVLNVIRETKRILEIIAIIGGQWPHSSYMVPGGIVSVPGHSDLLQCRALLRGFKDWYEQQILGCSLEHWTEVGCCKDLDHWLEENQAHRESALGFYLRFAREIGLENIGQGHTNFLSYGAFDLPENTRVKGANGQPRLIPAGFSRGVLVEPFDQARVAEHVAYSWFTDYEDGLHPSKGETQPYASGRESKKYSWNKAPRYDGLPTETGPLAEMVIAGKPLFTDLVRHQGPSVFLRQLARLLRPADIIPAMDLWLAETKGDGKFYDSPKEIEDGEGFGLTQATRGALGHWLEIKDGVIQRYQIITPTGWNASPRDSNGVRGPIEESLIGTGIKDSANPVELGHVVRSFDPCLVCTVH